MVTVRVFRALSVTWQHFHLPTAQINTKIRCRVEVWLTKVITPLSLCPLVHSFPRAGPEQPTYTSSRTCTMCSRTQQLVTAMWHMKEKLGTTFRGKTSCLDRAAHILQRGESWEQAASYRSAALTPQHSWQTFGYSSMRWLISKGEWQQDLWNQVPVPYIRMKNKYFLPNYGCCGISFPFILIIKLGLFCISSGLNTTYLVPHWARLWQISLPIFNTASSSQVLSLSMCSGFPPGWAAAVLSQVSAYETSLKGEKFRIADAWEESRLVSVTGHEPFSPKKTGTTRHIFQRHAIFLRILTQKAHEYRR